MNKEGPIKTVTEMVEQTRKVTEITVSDLIEFLQTQPPHLIVQYRDSDRGFDHNITEFEKEHGYIVLI